MAEFVGDFETHVTVRLGSRPGDEADLAEWAGRHEMKYTRIALDRGETSDQPMLTYLGRGTLTQQRGIVEDVVRRLRGDGFDVIRAKIEAAPSNADVPQTTDEAADLPDCYFEHHIKLAFADGDEVAAVRDLVEPHGAYLSRNARRALDGGRHERFVTARCHGVGRPEARRRLDDLVAALTRAGHQPVEIIEEFVVYDDNPAVDAGWLETGGPSSFDRRTRVDEPEFIDAAQAMAWRSARQSVFDHVLTLIAGWSMRNCLVLRGSIALKAWAGDEAREPGDFDWVVLGDAQRVLPYLLDLIRRSPETFDGVVLEVDYAKSQTDCREVGYEQFDSLTRVVIPWRADGLPPGTIGMDLAEDVWMPGALDEIRVPLRGEKRGSVLAASRELSLAWKILWMLGHDAWYRGDIQAKDLYDAVLLAEDPQTRPSNSFLQEVLDSEARECEWDGFGFYDGYFVQVDWDEFLDHHPWVNGSLDEWSQRLRRALDGWDVITMLPSRG